jgi:outer membrane protein
MNKISTVLSILCLGLIGVLFYLHFTHTEQLNKMSAQARQNAHSNFRIAYFDIDSLQAHYDHYKDALEDLKKAEQSMNTELEDRRRKYQNYYMDLQRKGPTMTQSEQENAQRSLQKMDKEFSDLQQSLQNNMQNKQMDAVMELRKEIEDYLATYNKEKGYTYIFSYDRGNILYYKDSAYDITQDVVRGLNETYQSRKKK